MDFQWDFPWVQVWGFRWGFLLLVERWETPWLLEE